MSKPRIGIVIGTTRPQRFSEKPAKWLHAIATQRTDLDFELLDLRDYALPLFNEPMSPAWAPPEGAEVRRWGAKLAELDGFILIAAEYNHGPAAVLKNALDSAYKEFIRKPVAFVGYGSVGGARAIEQLRMTAIELQMVCTRAAVHIGLTEFLGLWQQGKTFADYPQFDQAAVTMLDELSWWARTLKPARETA